MGWFIAVGFTVSFVGGILCHRFVSPLVTKGKLWVQHVETSYTTAAKEIRTKAQQVVSDIKKDL